MMEPRYSVAEVSPVVTANLKMRMIRAVAPIGTKSSHHNAFLEKKISMMRAPKIGTTNAIHGDIGSVFGV